MQERWLLLPRRKQTLENIPMMDSIVGVPEQLLRLPCRAENAITPAVDVLMVGDTMPWKATDADDGTGKTSFVSGEPQGRWRTEKQYPHPGAGFPSSPLNFSH